MACWVFTSIQSMSGKLLEAIRRTSPGPGQRADQNESVVEDLQKLSRMLRRIMAVQQDAEEREIHDRSVRLWLEELRGVAYEAEDVLDEHHYEVLRAIVESGDAAIQMYHQEDRGIKRKVADMSASSSISYSSSSITKISIPDGICEKIKSITQRFEEISGARQDLRLREDDGSRLATVPQIRPPTSSHVDERALFGREEEKETIISLLTPSSGPDFLVLPIVGMGGLGKTMLAQLVYNDSRIPQLFDKKSWVSVSEDFDLVRLTKAIIESISDSPCDFSELSKLQDVLKNKISGISLFLVLDDVWNEKRELWESFRVGFIGAKTVRILTTTRNRTVAEVMQTTSPFNLGYLPKEYCWSLFKHFAFGNREAREDANLLEIGRGIVEKCKGLPLAIKILGGILRYEMDVEKWREVLESNISEIDETGEIMPVLWLSYQKLRLHIKPCFLYLSIWPKGRTFEKDTMVRLWMAQGYINGNARNLKTLEDIGSEYFDELQGRSLIDRADGLSFLLHDLIHDLASTIFQGACQPVLENGQIWNSSCKMNHVCLTKRNEFSKFATQCNNRAVRTFVNFVYNMSSHLDDIFSKIACVRAVYCFCSGSLNTLGMLKHLRYIYVDNDMLMLPESICLLYNLQTLHLNCQNLQELPENMKNLINLRCLKLKNEKIKQLPDSIFRLQKLHTLSFECCFELKELPRCIEQLTELHILNLDIPKYSFSREKYRSSINMPCGIGKLTTLKLLNLRGHFNVMDDGMMGGLGELEGMNKLCGLLCISGLKNIGDMDCSRKANLASKPNLNKLILDFEETDHVDCGYLRNPFGQGLHLSVSSFSAAKSENVEKIQEGVLEGLQPCGTIRELQILHCRGRKFPSWLINSLLPKLTAVTIKFCNFLPPLSQLANGSSRQPTEVSFSSLEVLSLTNMLSLEWQIHEGDFTCLKELTVENCPKLWKIAAIIPREVGVLVIRDCGCREVQFSSESKIQDILISNCRELISIHSMGGQLPMLYKISVLDCPKLCKLSGMRKLPVLKSITLISCPVLGLFLTIPETIEMLVIRNCGFKELMLPSRSQKLTIFDCLELNSVNWRDVHLNFIDEVTFVSCPKLTLLIIPTQIKKLTIHKCGFHEIMLLSRSTNLMVSNCIELISINWSEGGLDSTAEVTFKCCPKLKLLTIPSGIKRLIVEKCGFRKIWFPSVSENLTILNCVELISVNWRDEHLNSIDQITFGRCPKLVSLTIPTRIKNLKSVLHLIAKRAEIYDCPRMDLGKGYFCKRDTKVGELNVLGKREIHVPHASVDSSISLRENFFTLFFTKEESPEVESSACPPLFDPSCQYIMLNLSSLVKVVISMCSKVISVAGLDNLTKLTHLSISCCQELCDWKDRRLPVALEFLELKDCDKLQSLPFLSVKNQSSPLKTLVIIKCPVLSELEGFYCLMNLRTVEIQCCKNISISPATESLNFRPHISISDCPLLRDWCQRNSITYYKLEL